MENINLKELEFYLKTTHECHTAILYGSFADGTYNENSDVDILCVRDNGFLYNDSNDYNGRDLDIWVYPEKDLYEYKNFLHIHNGKVLFEKDEFGSFVLANVNDYYEKGPEKLNKSEIMHRKAWINKMFNRAQVDDMEGNFRKNWLLTDLLETYFNFKNIWYLGSKKSFDYLQDNDIQAYMLFRSVYSHNHDFTDIENLINYIMDMEIVSK